VAPQVTTGRQQRDFIFVEDVIALLRCASENEKALGHILHAGTGRPHAVRDMVETIVGVCGRGKIVPQFELQPPRLDEPKSSVASIRQTCAVTGWTPRYDLQAGIEHTWNWFDHAGYRQAA